MSSEVFKILVFIGAQQARVSYDLIDVLQVKGSAARCIKISGTGRDALDFHIAYYIGKLAAAEPEAYFHVIAADKGMDPLMQHLQAQGIQAARWNDIQDIPIIKKAPSRPLDDKLSLALEYLVRRGTQRPTKLRTLQGSIAALFSPKLEAAEVSELLDALQQQHVFLTEDTRVIYNLPD